VPTNIVIVKGNSDVIVDETLSYSEEIMSVNENMGLKCVVTRKHIYIDQKEIVERNGNNKTLISYASDGTTIISTLIGNNTVTFCELIRQSNVGSISATGMFLRNGCIYTISNGKLIENSFSMIGNKTIHRTNELENISTLSSKMYDGVVIQNLLGNYYVTLPYAKGASFSKHIKELSGYRVIDAKSDKNVCIILAEKGGIYSRFIIVFDRKDYNQFDIRIVNDVSIDVINFTVLDNGMCIFLNAEQELEMFFNNKNSQVIKDPPIDISMRLISFGNDVYFINGNSLFNMKKK
jgi:hypothetical protein